ncbi:hypothetical protein Lal_00001958 [Lupinus albus]|nr:hypothetical protein Lal_00001958 [Lupinus albus]
MWVPTKKRRVEDQLRPNLRVKKASSVQNGYLPTEDSEVLQGQSAIKKLDRAEPELLLLTMTGQQWTLSQTTITEAIDFVASSTPFKSSEKRIKGQRPMEDLSLPRIHLKPTDRYAEMTSSSKKSKKRKWSPCSFKSRHSHQDRIMVTSVVYI